MTSITYNAELKTNSCYCGRFDNEEIVYPEEMTEEGECYSCIELSKNEDLNDEMDKKEEMIIEIGDELEFVDIKPYSHNIVALSLSILEKNYGRDAVMECFNEYRYLFAEKGWKPTLDEYGIGL
mgnify:CR=1 FL=1|tara:strand:- start:900 stop:1271 length:372 start_codon:yes stop_codon:yes gene_type:complete